MFICSSCGGNDGVLIRGQCKSCSPSIHSAHNEALSCMGELMQKFKVEKGMDALSDWYGFEEWMLSESSQSLVGNFIQATGQLEAL